MNADAIRTEKARVVKMLDRKRKECKEHEELIKMYEDMLKEPNVK